MLTSTSRRRIASILLPLALCAVPSALVVGQWFSRNSLEKEIARFDDDFKDVPEIDASAWKYISKYRDNTESIVLVDVRESRERKVSEIPGAISLSEYESNRESYRDRPVVTYCTIGYRSSKAARQLRRQGVDAFNFRGGIVGWTQLGGVLVDPKGKITNRVHTYGHTWNFVPKGYIAVW